MVGGQVYRLADTCQTSSEAVLLARSLKDHLYVVISRADDGRWAVYYRPKTSPAPCGRGCCGSA
ncbi:MAG: hypothetical protein C4K49_12325 [Candidatus Thorarchaeota archaeon]|nr:MAG: hypothetical protein C4K49_12325 [Candidatus Thorarchaeota archaeon]